MCTRRSYAHVVPKLNAIADDRGRKICGSRCRPPLHAVWTVKPCTVVASLGTVSGRLLACLCHRKVASLTCEMADMDSSCSARRWILNIASFGLALSATAEEAHVL